jgi:hypothetical protein
VNRHELARDIQDNICRTALGRSRLSDRARVDEIVGIVAKPDLVVRPRPHPAVSKLEDTKVMRVPKGADTRPRWMRGERFEAQPPALVMRRAEVSHLRVRFATQSLFESCDKPRLANARLVSKQCQDAAHIKAGGGGRQLL